MTCRAGHSPRKDFEPGHELSTVHGAYSPRRVGERADVVRAELVGLMPGIDDPEMAAPLALYCRATAREELAHEALEAGNLSPRLLEAASAAARVAKELGDALGIGPRAAAELRQIRAQTALSVATLAREAPVVLDAVQRTLAALGLAGRSEEFNRTLARQLAEVTDGEG